MSNYVALILSLATPRRRLDVHWQKASSYNGRARSLEAASFFSILILARALMCVRLIELERGFRNHLQSREKERKKERRLVDFDICMLKLQNWRIEKMVMHLYGRGVDYIKTGSVKCLL